jgi:hypothetical protein
VSVEVGWDFTSDSAVLPLYSYENVTGISSNLTPLALELNSKTPDLNNRI